MCVQTLATGFCVVSDSRSLSSYFRPLSRLPPSISSYSGQYIYIQYNCVFPFSFFLFPFSFSFLVFVFFFLLGFCFYNVLLDFFCLGWIIYTTGRCRASKGQKTNDGENTRNSTTMNISGHVRDAPQTNAGWAMCMSIRVAQLRTWSPSTHPSTLPRASMENNRPKTATWQYYTIAAILSNPRLPPTFI